MGKTRKEKEIREKKRIWRKREEGQKGERKTGNAQETPISECEH